MNKEQLVALGLTEEQADNVIKGFGNMIPKSRFDEVNDSNKQLKKDIADRDTQLEELKKVDAASLQKTIEDLQGLNKKNTADYEAKIKQIKLDNAIEKGLTSAKAKNLKAVRALLDLEKVELDGDNAKGLEEQLKSLQESEDSNFLFNLESNQKGNQFKGIKPGEKGDGNPGAIDTSKMTYSEMTAYLAANPNATL